MWRISSAASVRSEPIHPGLHENAISPAFDAVLGDERYKGIDPAISYRYSTSNIFVTQISDYTLQGNSADEVTSAYNSCLSDVSSAGHCDDDIVNLLQGYLYNFTQFMQAMPSTPSTARVASCRLSLCMCSTTPKTCLASTPPTLWVETLLNSGGHLWAPVRLLHGTCHW